MTKGSSDKKFGTCFRNSVSEPACLATFRDKLNLFPNDERAAKLNRATYTRGIPDRKNQFPTAAIEPQSNRAHALPPDRGARLSERRLLTRLGLDYTVLDSGCCGMAGAFGFDENKYEVSLKIGERVLLPSVRAASEDTLIISNGYSCREQIAQKRGGLHHIARK